MQQPTCVTTTKRWIFDWSRTHLHRWVL